MSRGFWAGMMLVSLILTGASASYLYLSLREKTMPVVTPIKPVRRAAVTPPVPVADQSASSAAALAAPAAPVEPQAAVEGKTAEEAPKTASTDKKQDAKSNRGPSQKQTVLFQYKKPTAKQVFVIGSFNKWFRQAMRKGKDGTWEFSIKLNPGTYDYLFVVDGKRTLDPNRPSDDGEKSTLIVESRAQKPAKPSN